MERPQKIGSILIVTGAVVLIYGIYRQFLALENHLSFIAMGGLIFLFGARIFAIGEEGNLSLPAN